MKQKRQFLSLAVSAALAFGSTASAAFINGSITFASGANGGVEYDTGNIATANSIVDFNNPIVVEGAGSFNVIDDGTSVSFTEPWVFDPSTPYSPLWTVTDNGTTFTFNLTSSFIALQNSSFLSISGTGVITGTGFDDTPGVWNFSSQGPGAEGKFSWSASTGNQVPDGGTTLVLLGASLLGLHGIRRKLGHR